MGQRNRAAAGATRAGVWALFPQFPERVSLDFYRVSGKIRFYTVVFLLTTTLIAGTQAKNTGFDMDVFWDMWAFHIVTHVAVTLLALWMWVGSLGTVGLRRLTYACLFIETITTLITMWVYGTVSSHMIIFAVVFVLVYRLAFDFRIGVTAFGTLFVGQWALVIAETNGLLPPQPIAPEQVDLAYQNAGREITAMAFISIMLFMTFAAANWAVARMRYKDVAIRLLRESLHAAEPGKVGRHTGRTLSETYVLGTLLGSGAMGEVYSASHRRTRRKVAVKVLHPHLVEDPEVLHRFKREAEVTGRLGSDHIVGIVDMADEEDMPYLVFELLEGEHLGTRLDTNGPLPWSDVAECARQMALGLDAAHRAGVVHRDLKPENIFLCSRDDGTLLVKILDFGVSKIRGGRNRAHPRSRDSGNPGLHGTGTSEGSRR